MHTDFEFARELIKQIYLTEIKNKRIRLGKQEVLHKTINNKDLKNELKNILEKYYNDGYGYKLLVKNVNLNEFTYTVCRKVLKDLDIKVRTGNNVITDNLKLVRAENARRIGTFKNWPVSRPDLIKNNKNFIGGYYYNNSKNKYVYLRSSWEYAYAKWLDDNKYLWDVEIRQYELKSGLLYLPDFFIYENDRIKKIVEIKSTFYYTSADRMKKFYEFKEIYKNEFEIELINLLHDILKLGNYTSKSNLAKLWKKNRIQEI